jgi:hypothetical protein
MSLHWHWSPECCPLHIATNPLDSLETFFPPTNLPIPSPTGPPQLAPSSGLLDDSTDNGSELSFHADIDHSDSDESDPNVLLNNNVDLQDVFSFPQAFTMGQKYKVQLLKIIHATGAPDGVFQSIMSWAQTAATAGYNFQPTPKKYMRQIHHLEHFVGMEACRPSQVSVSMYPHQNVDDKLDVIVFDFPTMLASLFNCPLLNKLENLVINPSDQFGKFESPNGLLGEVNSGQWYDTAYSHLVKDPNKDFLCPIIFTMDKTVISEMDGLKVYLILFTTSIFNRQGCSLLCV